MGREKEAPTLLERLWNFELPPGPLTNMELDTLITNLTTTIDNLVLLTRSDRYSLVVNDLFHTRENALTCKRARQKKAKQ